MSDNPVDFQDISGSAYSDFLNDAGLSSETVTEPLEDELKGNDDKSVKPENVTALEKRTNATSLMPMQTEETNKLAKALGSSIQIQKHVQANKDLLEASLLKLPETYMQDAVLPPETSLSDEAVKIFKSIPLLAWVGILVFLSVLAYLDSLRDLLIAVVVCSLTFFTFNFFLSKTKVDANIKRNQSRDNTIQTLETTKAHVMKSFDENVLKGHEMTLKAVENVENMRADVAKYQTKAADIMHERETEKDLQIQKMIQTGKLEISKLNAATVREITTIKANTELQVKNIDAETERARTQAEKLMEDNRLKNELNIKQLEAKTRESMKQLDINFQALDANLRADVDKTRVNAERDTELAREQHATERLGIEQNTELEKTRSSNQVEIVRAQEHTRQVEAQNRSRGGRKCIIT